MTPRDAFLDTWKFLLDNDFSREEQEESIRQFTESVDALLAESNKELLAEVERLRIELRKAQVRSGELIDELIDMRSKQ